MNNKKVLAFDLSSVCIGVVAAKIENDKPTLVTSCPIIPPKFDATILGYLKSKKKIKTSPNSDKLINSYVRSGETHVSEATKKRRDVEVRRAKDLYVLDYIGKNINDIVDAIKPDIIVVEKTEIFNGVLTSVLLAKVFGVLMGAATSRGIEVKEYKVSEVRKVFNIAKLTREFTKDKSEEDLISIPDMTKRVLRTEMERKYGHLGLKCTTDDEGDACVVFNYWCHINNIV